VDAFTDKSELLNNPEDICSWRCHAKTLDNETELDFSVIAPREAVQQQMWILRHKKMKTVFKAKFQPYLKRKSYL